MSIVEIPEITPSGKQINTVGVWISGGADSALLCYLLAEKIKTQNLSVKIQPLTIDYKRPFQFIAGNVVLKVQELLQAEHVFLTPIVYNPPSDVDWSPEELSNQFHLRNKENIIANKFQLLFSGITTNPPEDVQHKFNWGVLKDVEIKRGSTVPKETTRYFTQDEYEFFEIKPFFNLNKQDIADVYREKELLQTLFPLTRSCEKIGTVVGHCGECWWCEERRWAFNTL